MCLADVGRVEEVEASGATAVVRTDRGRRSVSLAVLTLEGRVVVPGEWLLVHTGLAVEVLDPARARQLAEDRTSVERGEGAT